MGNQKKKTPTLSRLGDVGEAKRKLVNHEILLFISYWHVVTSQIQVNGFETHTPLLANSSMDRRSCGRCQSSCCLQWLTLCALASGTYWLTGYFAVAVATILVLAGLVTVAGAHVIRSGIRDLVAKSVWKCVFLIYIVGDTFFRDTNHASPQHVASGNEMVLDIV